MLGVGWMLQVLPFQCSASVAVCGLLPREYPSAVQFVADVHEIPPSELADRPGGLGVGWMVQPPEATATPGEPTASGNRSHHRQEDTASAHAPLPPFAYESLAGRE
jgi:hypothetical protein